MNFTSGTTLFLGELVAGCLASLAISSRAQIGKGFPRFVASIAAVCATIAMIALLGQREGTDPANRSEQRLLLIGLCCALGMYLFASGNPGSAFERVTLFGSLLLALALLVTVSHRFAASEPLRSLWIASVLCAALVLGFVSQAMVLGHWYLVTPGLSLSHLGRINRAALAALYARAALLAVTLALFPAHWLHRDLAVFRNAYELLGLGGRVVVGLILPIVLGHMTSVTVRLKATQPATGILYASTVLVLMGELLAIMASDGLGLPA